MERNGLDISAYQKGINFNAIKNAGVEFLIVRAGFTGWGTGVSYNVDECFETFYKQAKDTGIPVGAYWYSCANTYDKGVAEANYMYDNCLKGKQFEYPIYIDVEDKRHQVGNKAGVTEAVKGFCETLENKGYYVGVYGSDISGFKEKMNLSNLDAYDKWVAIYGAKPDYVKSYGMWQHTSKGKINGYNGYLDANIAYKDYPTIMKNAGLNGYSKTSDTQKPAPTIKQTLYLPATAKSWNIYPMDKQPVVGNECGKLLPSKFGGLTYDILGWTTKNTAIIKTRDFGKVQIYVAPTTGAVIK